MNEPRAPYRSIPFERLGAATRLFKDFLHGASALRPLFGPPFDEATSLSALVKEVRARSCDREGLFNTLLEQAREMEAPKSALATLDLFRREGSLVVFAGQQPGLFTGPLYTLYKALTVESWAHQLSEHLGAPVLPFFWLSSDDHDFAEIEWAGLPSGDAFHKVTFQPKAAFAGEPVGRVRVDEGMEPTIAGLSAHLPESEFKPDVLASLRRAYAPGGRFVTAMGRLWYEMFPESRLVFVLPGEGALARGAAPVLCRAVTNDADLYKEYRTASDTLISLGYHAQVHKAADQTFLFHQQGKRRSIHTTGSNFVWEGATPITRDSLCEQVRLNPEYFSPNVLLRPIVQNSLFPTLGVVLGPSELAYHAQIGRLYDHFRVPRPAVLPRTSATVVEASVSKRLERLGADLAALRTDHDGEVARVLRARFPRDLRERFDEAAAKVEAVFDEIRPEITAFEPTLDATAKSAGVRARREMEQLAQRAHSAHKKKEEDTVAQLRRVSLQLFPEGDLQERKVNVVYYWARYGPDWLLKLRESWPAGVREHLLWEG